MSNWLFVDLCEMSVQTFAHFNWFNLLLLNYNSYFYILNTSASFRIVAIIVPSVSNTLSSFYKLFNSFFFSALEAPHGSFLYIPFFSLYLCRTLQNI